MPHHKKATDEELRATYAATQSCYKTAAAFGMCPQSVHERLKRLGECKPINVFSEDDAAILATEYERHAQSGKLQELADRLRRTKQFICRKAKDMGMTGKPGQYERDRQRCSEAAKEQIRKNGHPRGALGMKHTEGAKPRMSWQSRAKWDGMTEAQRSELTMKSMKGRAAAAGCIAPRRPHGSWKAAWREIAGAKIYFRSRWEYNYAVYLQWLLENGKIAKWEHEPETFWFEKIMRGVRSYLPDFRVTENDGTVEYHEVKGWMDSRSKTTLRRMKKYHPAVKLRVIDGSWFKANAGKISFLPGWEK